MKGLNALRKDSFPALPRDFFARDPREVACDLLGKLLVRIDRRLILAGRIVEAEAYLGAIDPGAHSYGGMTPRNRVLFGPPGYAYVYFIYGNHYCTNVSCQQTGDAGCVLLRALEPVCGIEEMGANRGLSLQDDPSQAQLRQLTSGPGRLSQALGITRERDNAVDLCDAAGGLYIGDDGSAVPMVSATPRINVTRAPLDAWRFIVTGNGFVSGSRKGLTSRR